MATRVLLILVLLFPGGCWALDDREWIDYAKQVNVQSLFPDLESQQFEAWFQDFIGEQLEIKWRINDCGEQDGSSRVRDFPICVRASAQLDPHRQLGVMILAGSYFKWISGEPKLFMLYLNEFGNMRGLGDLAEAEALLSQAEEQE